MPEFTGNIICDTREKNQRAIERVASAWRRRNPARAPLSISGSEIILGQPAGGIVRAGLGLGGADWGLEILGADGRRHSWDGARVETKWMTAPSDGKRGGPNDLFSSFTAEYPRLKREAEALAGLPPPSLAAFVIEGNASDFCEHTTPGGSTFKGQVWPGICSLSVSYHLPFIFSNHAADWVAAWLHSARHCDLTGMTSVSLTEPRAAVLVEDVEALQKHLSKASDPAQYFCAFSDDQVSMQAVRLCRLVQRHGFGFWFLDLPKDQVRELMLVWETKERMSCGLSAAGGYLADPPSSVAELAARSKIKGLHDYQPPKHGARRKRTVRIAWGEAEGDQPVFVCFEATTIGHRIRVTDPSNMIPPGQIDQVKPKQAAEQAADLFKVKGDLGTEREAMPELLKRLRSYWAKLRAGAIETEQEPVGAELKAKAAEPLDQRDIKPGNITTETEVEPCSEKPSESSGESCASPAASSAEAAAAPAASPSGDGSEMSESSQPPHAPAAEEPAASPSESGPGSDREAPTLIESLEELGELVGNDADHLVEPEALADEGLTLSEFMDQQRASAPCGTWDRLDQIIDLHNKFELAAELLAKHLYGGEEPQEESMVTLRKDPRPVSWEAVTTTFDAAARGRLVMLLGLAKVGKTAAAASAYQAFPAERVYWISAGELDGWITARNLAGQPINGCDVDATLEHPKELWSLFESLAKAGAHDVIVLDSFDGCLRWLDELLCEADPGARKDKKSGLRNLDKRGYGLLLIAAADLLRRLHRITLNGAHVIITCGARFIEGLGVVGPDLKGQAPLIVPRLVSDIGQVVRVENSPSRYIIFDDPATNAIIGSRSGFENIDTLQLGELLKSCSAEAPSMENFEAEAEAVMAGVAAASGIEPVKVDAAPPVEAPEALPAPPPATSPMGKRYDDEPPAAQPPQVQGQGRQENKRRILEAFNARQVPLDYCNAVAQRYGAPDWASWEPDDHTADYAASFVAIFGFALDKLGDEVACSFAVGPNPEEGRPGIPLNALPFHVSSVEKGCMSRYGSYDRSQGEPPFEVMVGWFAAELQAVSDEDIPF